MAGFLVYRYQQDAYGRLVLCGRSTLAAIMRPTDRRALRKLTTAAAQMRGITARFQGASSSSRSQQSLLTIAGTDTQTYQALLETGYRHLAWEPLLDPHRPQCRVDVERETVRQTLEGRVSLLLFLSVVC